MIHKEGYTIIGIAVILCSAIQYAIINWLPIAQYFSATLLFLLLLLIIQFFRNPNRPISELNDQLVYAPADGKVVIMEEAYESEYFQEQKMLISIFMSPLNVHVNRNPISGIISYLAYHPGKYLVAWHPKSSLENERTTVVIKNNQNEILLRQIAGALARRIVTYIKPGDSVKQGEDFGFIKFGSRVDIYLPLDAEIKVKIDQPVKGNVDVIAHI